MKHQVIAAMENMVLAIDKLPARHEKVQPTNGQIWDQNMIVLKSLKLLMTDRIDEEKLKQELRDIKGY